MARGHGPTEARRPPDWDWLKEHLDGIAEREKLYYLGKPAYGQIGTRIGRRSAIYNIVGRKHWPDYETLALLAELAHEPREEWLYAGGYPVPGRAPRPLRGTEETGASLPATLAEDALLVQTAASVLRDLGVTSPDDLLGVWEELQRARAERDGATSSSGVNGRP